MSTLQDMDPDWIELTPEEKRCLLGLQGYYKTFEDKKDTEAMKLAWTDLKREFPERLSKATWWK